jgi:hypothetical protein
VLQLVDTSALNFGRAQNYRSHGLTFFTVNVDDTLLRKIKISKFDVSIAVDKNIVWLDVIHHVKMLKSY